MTLTWKCLGRWLGIAALTLALPACSLPVRPAAAISARGQLPDAPLPEATPTPSRSLVQQVRGEAVEGPTDAMTLPAWPGLQAPGAAAAAAGDRPLDFWDRLDAGVEVSLQDHGNYYSWPNLAAFGLGLGAAAPLANTSADSRFRSWYLNRAHGRNTDGIANVVNYAGQLWVVAPVLTELAALHGWAPADYATDGGWFEWSNRSLRAIAVGFPPVLAAYGILGASRPDHHGSGWHPFQDIHGMSGHTFFGAVPFLTAASMTDNPLYQVPLVMGSFLTGWSRIHLDRHYLSQVALGWWSAYLAVRSVNRTEAGRGAVTFSPVTPEGPGVGVEVRY